MAVVVTGASGHVGANLIRALLRRKECVRALVHNSARALEGLPIETVQGDVLDPDSLREAFRGADTIYHLAAVISIDGDCGGLVPRVNVDGVRNVAEAALEAGVCRLVHCSSIHAFDLEPRDRVLDETRSRSDERPGQPAYDTSKARGERALRKVVERGLDAVIVNPTGILGPADFEGSRMGRVLLDLCRRALPSLVDGGFDWVDVRDVCDGMLAAAERGRTGESYLLSGGYRSVKDVAAIVESLTGIAPPRWTSPIWLARIGAPFVVAWGRICGSEPLYTPEALRALNRPPRISTHKAETELGFRARPLARTIQDALAWYVEHGMLPRGTLLRPAA
jgi:dihydroflavonol-4-reductase